MNGQLEVLAFGIDEYSCPLPDDPGSGYCIQRAIVCVGQPDASPARFESEEAYWGLEVDVVSRGDLDGDGLADFVVRLSSVDLDSPTLARGRADLAQLAPFETALFTGGHKLT